MNLKEIATRAAKTAVQTLLGVLTVQALFAGDVNAIRAAAVAAASAGVSVIWNAALNWAQS